MYVRRLVYFRNFLNASLQCCTCMGCGVNTSVAHVTVKFVGEFCLLKCAVTKLHTMSQPQSLPSALLLLHNIPSPSPSPPLPPPPLSHSPPLSPSLPLQCTHCLLRPCEFLLVSEPLQTTMKWDRPICGTLGKGDEGVRGGGVGGQWRSFMTATTLVVKCMWHHELSV